MWCGFGCRCGVVYDWKDIQSAVWEFDIVSSCVEGLENKQRVLLLNTY
jgi:hypothetical protein